MNRQVIAIALFCVLFAVASAEKPDAFKKGNLLALKQASTTQAVCSDGWLVEFSRDGKVVQEISLTNNSTSDCKLFTDDYYGRLTVSADGSRVILPCCHPDLNKTGNFLVSFAIFFSNGTYVRTNVLANSSSNNQVVNAALDGNDIWFSQGSHVYYTNVTMNTSVDVFTQDFFQVQVYKKNLYVGNYDNLPYTIAQVDTGLPKKFVAGNGTAYLDTNPKLSVNAFQFLDKYLVVNMYPSGINIYNLTSQALLYNVTDTNEIGQLVALLDKGQIIAHVHSIGNTPASIYSFPFSFEKGIGTLANATVLLTSNSTQGYAFKYYSPVNVPSAASGLFVSLMMLVATSLALIM